MYENYAEEVIKSHKYFRQPFSNQLVLHDYIYYPVTVASHSDIKLLENHNKIAKDYHLEAYSSLSINLPMLTAQKKIIHDGSAFIVPAIKRGIIIGMNGIGKSSFLKQLLYAYTTKGNINNDHIIAIQKNISQINFKSKKLLKDSIFDGIERFKENKVVLLIDGMTDKILNYINTFDKFAGCIFTSSYTNLILLPDYNLFILEPLSISLQISRAQGSLSMSNFSDYLEKLSSPKSQFVEFGKIPLFHSYLIYNFDRLKKLNRAELYLDFLKHHIHRIEIWRDLENIAFELIDKEITVFGHKDFKILGNTMWDQIKHLEIFQKSEPGIYYSVSEKSESDIESENCDEISLNESITEFSAGNNKFMLRFFNIRLLEIILAQSLLNQIEDSISDIKKPIYIESYEFQKIFSSAFPYNFFFSRKYRDILFLFSQLCQGNLFENLVKYLINMNSIEYCYIAESILNLNDYKEYSHLINKINQQKQELIIKDFSQGLVHCSNYVRSICKSQIESIGVSVHEIINTKIKSLLFNSSWMMIMNLKSLVEYIDPYEVYLCIDYHSSV